ncbi:MAG: bifunctional 2-C-methyl-D-erythritol 4-phosphate cytidylyltransferase/2-C-methyl-D-erythritol 2,4-cyclodiphosphate synthase [Hyphomicrobiales bacterium]|nr:bifunctional 2-C-methyl-D-erythritol 4-phosphate cytidylyltransferase/2-C-methyl-D-erythritol 2,4-cyclodiphosphate synthase [Hyphomicrobiales bacterium]
MTSPSPTGADTAVLIVAAGRGSRFGGDVPKQYRLLAGKPVLMRTLEAFAAVLPSAALCVVIHPDDLRLYDAAIEALAPQIKAQLTAPALGGASRQDSGRNGLDALAALNKKIVLIHDAARPFVSDALICDAVRAARKFGAAVPGFAVTDTIKQIDAAGAVAATPDRSSLRAVQTPQAFDFALIRAAHAAAKGRELTDDAAVAEAAGHKVHVFDGDPRNMKITTAGDLAVAESRLLRDLPDIRTGQGYDVHAFTAGDAVILGGVSIAHDKKLLGHSDADVLMHAVTDAIFGALADGDIGSHFPPSDPQWKGAASEIFLRYAVDRVRQRGGAIAHIDATVVCERPKVGPHRDAIRARLADIMALPVSRVAVKATTSERLGFTGREEGIAALAMATVRLPVGED